MANGATLSEILRTLASDVINEVLVYEAKRLIDERQESLEDGERRLVLNGRQAPRDALFPFGPVSVKAPRALDRRGGAEPIVFRLGGDPQVPHEVHTKQPVSGI